ncbi:MAG: hypothetical protein JST28_10275 [Acidobacteria bacterium]|nr:hypothetical protein [Acidobacteriota bacterium]
MDAQKILKVLDGCAESFDFPMLDNGYVYLAATRLSLYRTNSEWAIVIEVFGYSPRAGLPDTAIYTFASAVCNRDIPEQNSPEWVSNHLANHPNDDVRFVFPIEEGDWRGENELIAAGATDVMVRGCKYPIPPIEQYADHGIALEEPPRVHVFEFCRFLADVARDEVLATPEERRISVSASLPQILQLEEWCHPDLVNGEVPSESESFRQLAGVLAIGNTDLYRPSQAPNTHWRNWPDGGTL